VFAVSLVILLLLFDRRLSFLSRVSKRRRGYESRTTNLRDGMWVLMLAVYTKDMGLGAPRIGYYY
jgi:hypothetical protein